MSTTATVIGVAMQIDTDPIAEAVPIGTPTDALAARRARRADRATTTTVVGIGVQVHAGAITIGRTATPKVCPGWHA